MRQKSIHIPIEHHKLHLRHIATDQSDTPVLMLHGAIENGKIFYTHSGKGLGCFLAEQGFDVYVADLRGRGESLPIIKDDPNHGMYDSIVSDIPALIDYVYQIHQKPIHIICHSWGGVLLASTLVRFPELRDKVRSQICFGTKRQVTVWNLERLFKVDIVWKKLAPFIAKRKGYLDAVKFKFGSDNETFGTLNQGQAWVRRSNWVDTVDGFNYGQAAKEFSWPPTWHLTGIKDMVLGHRKDVKLFIDECYFDDVTFSVLSKKSGAKQDYDHIDILTSKYAVDDHFPEVSNWLKQH